MVTHYGNPLPTICVFARMHKSRVTQIVPYWLLVLYRTWYEYGTVQVLYCTLLYWYNAAPVSYRLYRSRSVASALYCWWVAMTGARTRLLLACCVRFLASFSSLGFTAKMPRRQFGCKSYCDGTSTLGLPKARSLLVFPWEHSTACVDMTTVHAPPFGIRPTCWLRARGRSWSPPSLAWSPVSSISSIVINRN